MWSLRRERLRNGSDVCPRPSRGYPGSLNRTSCDNNPQNKTKQKHCQRGAPSPSILLASATPGAPLSTLRELQLHEPHRTNGRRGARQMRALLAMAVAMAVVCVACDSKQVTHCKQALILGPSFRKTRVKTPRNRCFRAGNPGVVWRERHLKPPPKPNAHWSTPWRTRPTGFRGLGTPKGKSLVPRSMDLPIRPTY